MKLIFHIGFSTKTGESLELEVKENGHEPMLYPMVYNGNGVWNAEIDYYDKEISYHYRTIDDAGKVTEQELAPHFLKFVHNIKEYKIYDTWNRKNFPENYLNNKILKNQLQQYRPEKVAFLKKHTHLFQIEVPLYNPRWRVVLLGNVSSLGNWEYLKTLPMKQVKLGVWQTAVEIPEDEIIYYKYAIMDVSGKMIGIEGGSNRYAFSNKDHNQLHILADHYYQFQASQMFHAAGVAVPVFSLRSEKGFGVGEFRDLKLLADWAKETHLGILQILPINDTIAHHQWTDSYPYAAISVYALHPQYLSVDQMEFAISEKLRVKFEKDRVELNNLLSVDYDTMMQKKWKFIQSVFDEHKTEILKDRNFRKFNKDHESWLFPYAAFCVQRDKYKTPDFKIWKTHKNYIPGKVLAMFQPKNKNHDAVMLHCWVQYQLHLQLKEAVDYIHQQGISLKGDLPIGIFRYSVEAWTEPELFGMDFQAGAPPDQFTELGQNWEFPTYNWEAMKKNGYQWWKNRFKALEQYFDAMRIDHILGFFRIWRMPVSATQGILGYFYPAIPITEEELSARSISMDFDRFCRPFINDQILIDEFPENKEKITTRFFNPNDDGTYFFKPEFETQRKIKEYFEDKDEEELEEKLLSLAANILLIEEEKENGKKGYHPRFNIHFTRSYQYLSDWEKKNIYELYLDYFYKRQDELWRKSAMEKLPEILNASEMLICGEDLGLVPNCVPQVMDHLAITALKVQRMPSEDISWYDPKTVSYMNVVTASSHDSSTLRQWWGEDRALTQKYFNEQLQQWGSAPSELLPELAEIIMKQHLYNDAMLAIFPIQEFLATDSELKNPDKETERINVPAIFPHHWKYRMHLNLEELITKKNFNHKIANWVEDSGRKL